MFNMTTKDNPINKNEVEFSLFKDWATCRWFIKFFDDKVVVEKSSLLIMKLAKNCRMIFKHICQSIIVNGELKDKLAS